MAPIAATEAYIACLHSLAEPTAVLVKHGFIFEQLDENELLGKRKCSGCGKAMSKLNRKRPLPLHESGPFAGVLESKHCRALPLSELELKEEKPIAMSALSTPRAAMTTPTGLRRIQKLPQRLPEPPEKPQFRCRYHIGECVDKVWTCCNEPAKSDPCGGADEHIPIEQELHELTALHQCYPTPPLIQIYRPYLCEAVAIDCEMGTAVSGDSELIRITMVDYFSGGILIDNYVEPDVPMLHLNTKYSGVTWADIKNARRQGNILQGKAHARQAIWNYVGPNTLVVGHAVINDLRALKWFHMAVVDSFIMEEVRVKAKQAEEAKLKEAEDARLKEEEEKRLKLETKSGIRGSALHDLTEMDVEAAAAPKEVEEKPRVRKHHNLSLKTLAKRYLDRDIQIKGKAGHDSLEDALAARDIVHCNVLMLMEGVAG